ncbi:MAG: hypothetical protein R3E34_11960 [Rhodocyclaceae bacterium]
MLGIRPERLLSVWEQGARRHPIDRAVLLHALAAPDVPVDQLADAPLGARNAALMALRRAHFGGQLPAWVDCPACGERMEFTLDAADLPPVPAGGDTPIVVDGHRFRRPSSRHLAAPAQHHGPRRGRAGAAAPLRRGQRGAARRCRSPGDAAGRGRKRHRSRRPLGRPRAGLACPACAHETEVSFDIASYLWEELDSHARRLLDDVHALAGAYGWSEPQILALSDARRAAYLARVQP